MLLAGIIVRNTLVTYDREKNKLGFWKTNCSELWKRLQDTGSPPPAPLVPQNHNSTSAISPSIAPSGLTPTSFPGKKSNFYNQLNALICFCTLKVFYWNQM